MKVTHRFPEKLSKSAEKLQKKDWRSWMILRKCYHGYRIRFPEPAPLRLGDPALGLG